MILLRLSALSLLSGCVLMPGSAGTNETGRGFIAGTVDRGDGPVEFRLFKNQYQSCCDEFEVPPSGQGFMGGPDGKFLAYFQLNWTGWVDAQEAEATDIPVGSWGDFGTGDYGAYVTWIEQPRGHVPGEDPIFRQTGDDGASVTIGNVTIFDTDYSTFVEARVEAILDNQNFGTRTLDVTFRWEDTGNP